MGAGIAEVALRAGIPVKISDPAEGAYERALAGIAGRLDRDVERGRTSREDADAALARVGEAPALEDLADCDAVVEAVVEILDVKQDVFRRLCEITAPDALLATNTSALPITEIAARADRPERVIGMHFFSPVPKMPLCEIVRGYRTSDATAADARALAAALGKETVLVQRDDAGFITSRIMTALVGEAVRIVESGLATAEDVDRACQLGFGHAMGPLRTTDLTGVDVALRAAESMHSSTGDPAYRPPQLLRRMAAAGALGRKTGAGFYDYAEEA